MIARCAQRRVNSVSLSNLRLLPWRRTKPVVTGDDTLVSRLAARSLIEHSELKSATVGPILVIINQGWRARSPFSLCPIPTWCGGCPGLGNPTTKSAADRFRIEQGYIRIRFSSTSFSKRLVRISSNFLRLSLFYFITVFRHIRSNPNFQIKIRLFRSQLETHCTSLYLCCVFLFHSSPLDSLLQLILRFSTHSS